MVDHLPSVMQLLPVGGPQYNSAARGQNTVWLERELANDRLLHVTETVFALALKILPYRAA